ncbi:UvrD-helicase domain-containing protein [Arthrobacter luteolus]|uniref:UvrD-helicase domain-containing protein n=1 Tax=Arthrobacter luteolus TaxID=98672 RepID=UPI00384CCC57
MPAKALLAVAGGGKTQKIADQISTLPSDSRTLSVTYTTNGQNELASRLLSSGELLTRCETLGWYSLLLRHVIKPYLPAIFSDVHPRGLQFIGSSSEIPRTRSGWRFYFNDQGDAYSNRISVLANKIIAKTKGAPIDRLSGIFDYLFIDEVQDLCGNDLDITRALMRSRINVFVVGDARQALFNTSTSDQKYKQFRGARIADWLRQLDSSGHCELTESSETRRFNATIAAVSDLVHDPDLNFPKTISSETTNTGHDGVFLVDTRDLAQYVEEFSPTILRARSDLGGDFECEVLNFGEAKGLTRDRVAIISTAPIRSWLTTGQPLAESAQGKFYVALTRSRYSSAIIADNAAQLYGNLRHELTQHVKLHPSRTAEN